MCRCYFLTTQAAVRGAFFFRAGSCLLPRDMFWYFAQGHKSLQLMSQCYCLTREQGRSAELKGVRLFNSRFELFSPRLQQA